MDLVRLIGEPPPVPRPPTTLVFLCDACHGSTQYSRVLESGQNFIDLTCPCCGELWHISLQVLCFTPLLIGNFQFSRILGKYENGTFFPKGQLQ